MKIENGEWRIENGELSCDKQTRPWRGCCRARSLCISKRSNFLYNIRGTARANREGFHQQETNNKHFNPIIQIKLFQFRNGVVNLFSIQTKYCRLLMQVRQLTIPFSDRFCFDVFIGPRKICSNAQTR